MITNEGAYIISQSVCAMIEAMGMHAENMTNVLSSKPPEYGLESFRELHDKYGLGHNAVTDKLSK